MPDDIAIDENLSLPGEALQYHFSRAGGPGGQGVNRSASRVQLRFDLEGCAALRPAVKARIRDAHPGKVCADGSLLLCVSTHRAQVRNLTEARQRLAEIVRSCLRPPRPRRATRPGRAARERRLAAKAHRAARKRDRRRPPGD